MYIQIPEKEMEKINLDAYKTEWEKESGKKVSKSELIRRIIYEATKNQNSRNATK